MNNKIAWTGWALALYLLWRIYGIDAFVQGGAGGEFNTIIRDYPTIGKPETLPVC